MSAWVTVARGLAVDILDTSNMGPHTPNYCNDTYVSRDHEVFGNVFELLHLWRTAPQHTAPRGSRMIFSLAKHFSQECSLARNPFVTKRQDAEAESEPRKSSKAPNESP